MSIFFRQSFEKTFLIGFNFFQSVSSFENFPPFFESIFSRIKFFLLRRGSFGFLLFLRKFFSNWRRFRSRTRPMSLGVPFVFPSVPMRPLKFLISQNFERKLYKKNIQKFNNQKHFLPYFHSGTSIGAGAHGLVRVRVTWAAGWGSFSFGHNLIPPSVVSVLPALLKFAAVDFRPNLTKKNANDYFFDFASEKKTSLGPAAGTRLHFLFVSDRFLWV